MREQWSVLHVINLGDQKKVFFVHIGENVHCFRCFFGRVWMLVQKYSQTLTISNDLGERFWLQEQSTTSKVHPFMPSLFLGSLSLVGYWSKNPKPWWSEMVCKWEFKKKEKGFFVQNSAKCILSCHLLPLLANCTSLLLYNLLFPDVAPREHKFGANLYGFLRQVASSFTSNRKSNYFLAV